jgi:drug/metabolite transporter (DMT)-like permease
MTNENEQYQSRTKTYLMLVLIQFFWGFLAPVAKIAFGHFDPMFIIFLRVGISSLFFYIVYRLMFFEGPVPGKDLLTFAALGFLGVAVSQVSFINGVARTTSINSLIILATIPINTLIFSVLFKLERFSILKAFAIMLAFTGVFFIVGIEGLTLSGNTFGNLLILVSSLSYSLYLVLSKSVLKKHKPFKLLTYVFLFGFLEVLPFSIFRVFDITANPVHIRFWWAPMVVVIVGTLLPNMLTIFALKNVRASIVGVFSYLEPLFGVILSILMLGEKLKVNNIIAAVLILAGIIITSSEERINKRIKELFLLKGKACVRPVDLTGK